MGKTQSQELIRKLKEVKTTNEITYPRIMDRMERNGKFVSLSTLRRVFADGSEAVADSFNYENTLLPIAEVLLEDDLPTAPKTQHERDIEELKTIIHIQNEENARMHDLIGHLQDRIAFLRDQIELKDRRMDERDKIIQRLMDKVL